ncbi:MAG: hypothetical protein LBO70_07250 [Clostridiales Family XIII bacterium]|jgi:glycine cleavage system H lipoate-binding protein|nr:hypothetical protein [Clostridiales Family XIII bacterium]
MNINAENLVAISEANQNFSRVARLVIGEVITLNEFWRIQNKLLNKAPRHENGSEHLG